MTLRIIKFSPASCSLLLDPNILYSKLFSKAIHYDKIPILTHMQDSR